MHYKPLSGGLCVQIVAITELVSFSPNNCQEDTLQTEKIMQTYDIT